MRGLNRRLLGIALAAALATVALGLMPDSAQAVTTSWLNRQVKAIKATITKIKATNTAQWSHIDGLKAVNASQATAITAVQGVNGVQSTDIAALRSRVSAAEANGAAVAGRVASLEASRAVHAGQIVGLDSGLQAVEGRVAELEGAGGGGDGFWPVTAIAVEPRVRAYTRPGWG